MGDKPELSKKTLVVQGSDKVKVPPEISGFFLGEGISREFLKRHYGLGRSFEVVPSREKVKAQMTGR